MQPILTMTWIALLLLPAALMAEPPGTVQAPRPCEVAAMPIPPRTAHPQTVERMSYPPRAGRQLHVDDPIVEDVIVQPRITQRVTYLQPIYERETATAAYSRPAAPAPVVYAAPRRAMCLQAVAAEPCATVGYAAGGEVEIQYGPLGFARYYRGPATGAVPRHRAFR